MKQHIKRYNRNKNGRVLIDMTVNDDTEFLTQFSRHNTPVISSEVADFLENSTQNVLPKDRLHLKIHSNCIDENKKTIYTNAIKDYYTDKVIATKRELRHNNVLAIVLALVGILILALSLIMDGTLWPAVIDIVAWVFLWEAVDIVAFKQRDLRLCRYRYSRFTEMEIEYSAAKEEYH